MTEADMTEAGMTETDMTETDMTETDMTETGMAETGAVGARLVGVAGRLLGQLVLFPRPRLGARLRSGSETHQRCVKGVGKTLWPGAARPSMGNVNSAWLLLDRPPHQAGPRRAPRCPERSAFR
ncbi:hypothetical protein CP973_20540 [Streptomyces albofaciens JCM 4342]|nr:hypothetical protein CP973_20540 [Streptomyces albofaciens JCM 4342]